MTKKRKSNRNGASNGAMVEPRPDLPYTGVELTLTPENRPTSDMSASTAPKSRNSPPTPNSQETPNALHAKALGAFAAKLGALVEWRHIQLGDGRRGYALFFPDARWIRNSSGELLPR